MKKYFMNNTTICNKFLEFIY